MNKIQILAKQVYRLNRLIMSSKVKFGTDTFKRLKDLKEKTLRKLYKKQDYYMRLIPKVFKSR